MESNIDSVSVGDSANNFDMSIASFKVDFRRVSVVVGLLFAFKFVVGQMCLYHGLWGGALVQSSLFY